MRRIWNCQTPKSKYRIVYRDGILHVPWDNVTIPSHENIVYLIVGWSMILPSQDTVSKTTCGMVWPSTTTIFASDVKIRKMTASSLEIISTSCFCKKMLLFPLIKSAQMTIQSSSNETTNTTLWDEDKTLVNIRSLRKLIVSRHDTHAVWRYEIIMFDYETNVSADDCVIVPKEVLCIVSKHDFILI